MGVATSRASPGHGPAGGASASRGAALAHGPPGEGVAPTALQRERSLRNTPCLHESPVKPYDRNITAKKIGQVGGILVDGPDFDDLSRRVGSSLSRRRAFWTLGGGLGGLLTLVPGVSTEAGKKKKKKKKKKKRGCPKDSFECPDGSCVPSSSIGAPANAPTCCNGESCGECGVCVNGRCTEVVGICDSAACERCSRVHWSCESTCSSGQTCCGSGDFGICCGPSAPVCAAPCGNLPVACCTQASYDLGHCCNTGDGGGG